MKLIKRLVRRFVAKVGKTKVGSTSQSPPPMPALGDECRTWRQGDVFGDAQTFVFDSTWSAQQIDTLHGAAIVSQSCDASLPARARIQIAPVVRLEDGNDINEAASGRRTQFVALPCLGKDFFADLDGITTVAKTALLASERVKGVKSDQEIREFAFAVGRRFGRFAYPDEVVECLEPLSKHLRSKARKEQSPLGQVLSKVHSFRIRCEDWSLAPYQLTLIVILNSEVVPSNPDDIGPAPSDLTPPQPDGLAKQLNGYATYLNQVGRTPDETYYAWQYLADGWALQCETVASTTTLNAHVRSVSAELAAVDDFALSQYLDSESLDLDYLSDARKPIQ